jgi:hypothetical protein
LSLWVNLAFLKKLKAELLGVNSGASKISELAAA